jgi:outer membrane protein assembly factor BamB
VNVFRPAWILGAVLGSAGVATAPDASAYDWVQFNGDAAHSGRNTLETSIGPGNVGKLQMLFQVSLPAIADGAPAVLGSVPNGTGAHDLLFVDTKDGHVIALDAHTGGIVWSRQVGPGTCRINNGAAPCYTTSSPAIDPGRGFVYAYGLDGAVHKYAASSGAEVLSGGWPEVATLKPFDEKGSSALTVATVAGGATFLYVTNGGYPGDAGDYQGHVTAINLATGAQNVFNAACSDQTVHFVETPGSPDCPAVQSAIWARGSVVYDPSLDEIFMATGNGNYVPASNDWGDTVFALHSNGVGGTSGQPLDAFTPSTFQVLQNADADLGSTAPAILPVPVSSNVAQLAVQSGKDGLLRLLNLANLSSQGGPGHIDGNIGPVVAVPQGGDVLTQIAVWVNPADGTTWAFVANGSGISGLRLAIDASGNPSLVTGWLTAPAGTSPVVANGVLYYAATTGQLRALDPTTGTQLWQAGIGGIHWESPVVANGVVYITDESGRLTAFALPPGASAPVLPAGVPWLLAAAIAAVGAYFAVRRGAADRQACRQ